MPEYNDQSITPKLSWVSQWNKLHQYFCFLFDLKYDGRSLDFINCIILQQAIYQGYLYAVQYPLYDGLTAMSSDPFGCLMGAFSPIAFFASKPGRQENKLEPVAIQINSSSGELKLIYRVSSLSSGHTPCSVVACKVFDTFYNGTFNTLINCCCCWYYDLPCSTI